MPPRRGTRDRRGRALPRHRARSASRTSLASGRRFAVRRRAWPLIVFRRQVDRTARAPYRAVLTATDPGGRSTAKPVLAAFTIVVDRKARPSAVSDSGPWRRLLPVLRNALHTREVQVRTPPRPSPVPPDWGRDLSPALPAPS